MASVIAVIAAAALSVAVGTNEALSIGSSSSASLASMRKYFVRSDKDHTVAMDSISSNMTAAAALHVLEHHEHATPMLVQLARRVMTARSGIQQSFLGAGTKAGAEGGGFQALELLNSMVYESMKKYDTESAKCTDYYSKQCGMLESIRGELAATNFKSADCRTHTLRAQSQISLLETTIPEMGDNLKQHELKCKHEVHELGSRLKVVLGDIAVLTHVLEMSECSQTSMLLQVNVLHCKSNCSKQKFVAVDHPELQKHLSGLRSSVAISLMQEGFSDMAADNSEDEDTEKPVAKLPKTKPILQRTEVPDHPCDDPHLGAPSPKDKRAAKCTVSGAPSCNKMQERFLVIQAGIQDERDDLKEEIAKMEGQCESTKANVQAQLKDEEQNLMDSQTNLASSMTCEANAAEAGRLGNKEHTGATADLKRQMKTCSGNYQNFETEICGLKKIRGELHKMQGSGKPAIFQDCAVGAWVASECSKPCGGGVQQLTRPVSTQPQGGAKCLPLAQMKSCEDSPCPVDCRLEAWSGWSKCSAQCGGGVMQRLRDVKRHMKFNGKPCGETSQTTACNVQSCESDCELSDWSKWSACSKACDGGTRKRQKFVKNNAVGQGSCAGMWDKERLDYKQCNHHRCKLQGKATTLTCTEALDIVLVVDGSASLGKKGWLASKKAAANFVSAFAEKGTKARFSLIVFSGPSKYPGVKKCFAENSKPVDVKTTCKINVVEHFTDNLAKVKSEIAALPWPKGSTLTSLALSAARSELSLGRKDAKSVVVVITDGKPLSSRKTARAARDLRKAARLVWVPVTKFAPLAKIRSWATRRWQENVVPVKSFGDLSKSAVVSRLVADICPSAQ